MQATLEALTADIAAALGGPGDIVGGDGRTPPRFDVYHGANSICSQKVRTVLAHLHVPYMSHSLNIFLGETYLPSHVRLRMIGCDRLGVPLQTTHKGSTAVSFGGCDPAVVPTLVDRETEEVIVDSKRICIYLDDLAPEAERLRPAALRRAIDAELEIVDNLPNYQMLAGRPPGEHDGRPGKLHGGDGTHFANSKVARCERYMTEFADDEVLARAYAAKRAKELEGGETLFTGPAMRQAYNKAEAACVALQLRLAASSGPWLLGPSVTMADLFWGVELLRMKNLGAGAVWQGGRLPAVERFVASAEGLPSIRSAVLEWPGALY